jgi:hypothetical protein
VSDERPLLGFEGATTGAIPAGPSGFPPPPRRPNAGRQGERLTPQFAALREAIEARRLELAETSAASDPELVVVFDLVATVDKFLRAVRDIEGLEFLADLAEDGVEADDDFFIEKEGLRTTDLVPQSLYMIMTNARAVTELVSLFERWQADPTITFETGLNPLKQVFASLRSIRRWGPEDRVRDTGLLEQWQQDLDLVGQQGSSRVEIELWYRTDQDQRSDAEQHVHDIVERAAGTVITSATIDSIRYHAVLADLPTHLVEETLEQGVEAIELLTTDTVMFVSPSVPMTIDMPEVLATPVDLDGGTVDGPPRVALLDGLPLANHAYLDDRLIIDDPDDIAAEYTATAQIHGTAMASLLIHGDLSNPGLPMTRPLYVRPVLTPHPVLPRHETTPRDELLVDLVARCLHRMFEGDGDDPPTAPSVRIVNLSIGDPARVFVRQLSPLAKLLDWYAHRFNLLIVVSGGNHHRTLTLDAADLDGDSDAARAVVARGLFDAARQRRLLSPAEAINVLTVGALHDDGWPDDLPATVVDLVGQGLPAGYSPVGHGYRRAIKPEVLLPGGRQVHTRPPPGTSGPVEVIPAGAIALGPGLRSAAPGPGGDRTATTYSCGTSNAAALASRTADQIIGLLEEVEVQPGELLVPDAQYHPVVAKALLVHAASWGSQGAQLATLLKLPATDRRRQLSQLLGYGPVDLSRVASADRVRPVLIAASSIKKDKRDTYRYPLPPSLSTTTWWRRLTITLAWLSPVNTRSQRHRMARLSFSPPDTDLQVHRTEGDYHAVQRGTVQHEILEGNSAVAFTAGDAMEINVDCRVDAGTLNGGSVRYALVASVEVAEEIGVDLHAEVQAQLRAAVQVRARQRT